MQNGISSNSQHNGQQNGHSNEISKLSELIKDVRIAMLTTVDEEGSLRSRPMATQQAPFDGNLWFFTDIHSAKAYEVRKDNQVNVSYAAPDDNKYISVSGTASVVQDKNKAKELWNPILKAWFPKGIDDPDLCLLKIDVEKAEYWDTPSGKMVTLFSLVKSLVTGHRYEGEGSDHKKINL